MAGLEHTELFERLEGLEPAGRQGGEAREEPGAVGVQADVAKTGRGRAAQALAGVAVAMPGDRRAAEVQRPAAIRATTTAPSSPSSSMRRVSCPCQSAKNSASPTAPNTST